MVSVETVCGSTEFVCCFQESLGNYEDVIKVFLIQHLGGPNCLHPILTRHPLKWTKMDILHNIYHKSSVNFVRKFCVFQFFQLKIQTFLAQYKLGQKFEFFGRIEDTKNTFRN